MSLKRAADRKPRGATAHDAEHLAELWFAGWRDAHAHLVAEELAIHRSLASFRERMEAGLHQVRTVGPIGSPFGFSLTRGNELYQLYVADEARGTGVAAALLADAESVIARTAADRTWLHCAIGNDRAAKFYERSGWVRLGIQTSALETATGTFLLDVWRYEKRLKKLQSPRPQR